MAGNIDINTGAGTSSAPKSKFKYSTGEYGYDLREVNGNRYVKPDMEDWDIVNGSSDSYVTKNFVESKDKDNANYSFRDKTGKIIWIDKIDDAPKGVMVRERNPFKLYEMRDARVSTGANVLEQYNALRQAEFDRRSKGALQHYDNEQKKQKEAEAKAKADQQRAEEEAFNNKVKRERENASKAELDFILSDKGFNAKDSTGKELYSPDDVLKKMSESGIFYEEAKELLKGTKWETSDKRTAGAIAKYYPEITRGADRRELWAEVKAQNPDITEEQFLAIENEEGNEIINKAKGVIIERKQKEEEERKRLADEQARKEQEEIDRLEKQGKAANTEAEQRKLNSDLDKKAREFEEKYPFPIAQFWNPGWDWKKKVLLLGEILANFGANITRGAVAGFNRQVADPVESPMNKYFKDALAAKNERYQRINQVKAKSVADSERRESIIDSLPNLKLLSNKERENIAVMFEGNVPSFEQFSKALEDFRTPEQRKAMYEEFKRGRVSYAEGSGNYSANLSNRQAEENLKFTQVQNLIKNSKDANDYIQSLKREKAELQQSLIDVDSKKEEDYWKAANYVMNFVTGIETVNSSNSGGTSATANSSNTSSANSSMSAGITAGYAGIGANIGASKGTQTTGSKGESTTASTGFVNGRQTNLLAKLNIPVAQKNGKDFLEMTEKSRQALKKAIQDQINYIDDVLMPEAMALKERVSGINDGIIKAPGQKQWIVREDGSKVELDPMDNIYATKNEITTENDNGADVVPMELTDTVEVIQKKLGYDGGNINKDFDYYLTKLKK